MSYKYFGRLAGGSNAGDSLSQTADNNTTTPYSAQRPATKFMAFGESATSLNMNRALAALSANSDYLSSVLDTPSLRKDVLTPVRDNGVGSTQSGFSALTSLGFGSTAFNLALANSPVVWVYVGLHKDSLSKTLRAYRVKSGEYIDGAYPDIAEMDMLHITDVKINSSSATSYFDGQAGTYVGTPELALAEKVPGITLVQTGLAPYSGNPETVNIASWDEDGPRIGDVGTPMSWADIYARPGCFVLVSGETGVTTNNGLYRISSISGTTAGTAGDKAILTRGGLHKVTVADATNFDVGRRVAWRSSPNHATTSTKAQRENTAYVMFKVGNDLYLSSFSSPEDFGIQGTAVGYRITDDASTHGPVHRTGSVGLADQEESADQNWSLPLGTLLYNNDTGDNSAVTAVIPSGYPVKFATNSNVGNIQLCAPPGFLLNPLLEVDGTKALNGDYYIHCHTLTTNREKLLSPGQSANRFTYESSADRLVSTEGDENRHKAFAKFLRVGYEDLSDVTSKVHPASYGATKQILGEGLWKVSIDDEGNTKDITTSGLVVGQSIGWKHPYFLSNTQSQTTSTVVDFGVEGGAQYLILKDVENAGWEAHNVHIENDPLIVGATGSSFTTIGGTDYYISSIIYGPYLKDDQNNEYVPSFGLNAAYHNHYDASKKARGTRGLGNVISSVDGRPLTVILPQASTNPGLVVRTVDSGDPGNYDLISLLRTDGIAVATVGYSNHSITFEDTNTGADIAFSDADHTSLPLQHASVLASLEASHLGGQNFSAFSSGVLHFGGFSNLNSPTNLDVTLGESYYHYKGAKLRMPQTVVSVDGALSDQILFYDSATDAYATEAIADFDLNDQTKIGVARVKVGGAAISSFAYCGYSINRVDQRTDILVGTLDSDNTAVYTNNLAHFLTLGEAFKAIEAWDDSDEPLTPVPGSPKRSYTITVVGDTVEQVDATRDIALPLTVPSNQQITIRGSVSGADAILSNTDKNAVVSWSADEYLLNIDRTRGLIVENLATKWTGALIASSDAVPAVAPYYSVGSPGGSGLETTDLVTIKGCQHFGGEAFLVMPAVQAERVTVRDCHSITRGAALHFQEGDFSENSKLVVDNCVFEMYADGFNNYRNEGEYAAAVYIGAADVVFDHVSITSTIVKSAGTDGFHRGVHIYRPGSTVLISDNTFENIGDTVANFALNTSGGIRVVASPASAEVEPLITIRGNKFLDMAAATAIYAGSSGNYQIIGNLFNGALETDITVPARSGDYTIETNTEPSGVQIKDNVFHDTWRYALKLSAANTQVHSNRINPRGSLSTGALVDVLADNVDLLGNHISVSQASSSTDYAISVGDNLAYVNISDNFIKNTRSSGGAGTPRQFSILFDENSAYVHIHGNTIVGNDGGNIETALAAAPIHSRWSVKGNDIVGDIHVSRLLDSHIKDNTLTNLKMESDGTAALVSERVIIESNVLFTIQADLGGTQANAHRLTKSVVSDNVLTGGSETEGILLGYGAINTHDEGCVVSANIFSGNAGFIHTGYKSTVNNNVNVRKITTGQQDTDTDTASMITNNSGGNTEQIVINSFGGSTISGNSHVGSIATDEDAVVTDNTFSNIASAINIFGPRARVTGNRVFGTAVLTINVGNHATATDAADTVVTNNYTQGGDIIVGNDTSNETAHGSVVSGNSTAGGDIKVGGDRCTISNNTLGFITSSAGAGVGSIYVGIDATDASSGASSGASYENGGKHCTVMGNSLVGGTIWLLRGQNTIIGNILVYTEGAASGSDSQIGSLFPGVPNEVGAIIIDYGNNRGSVFGDYHNNVIIGNLYRSGIDTENSAASLGPAITVNGSKVVNSGEGDIIDGEDLTQVHILDNSAGVDVRCRLNAEE